MTYAIDADAAFALLRRYSQLHNIKVRDLARAIVETMSGRQLPEGARESWDRLAAEMFPRSEHRAAPAEQAGQGG
jgi:hypothetical protein